MRCIETIGVHKIRELLEGLIETWDVLKLDDREGFDKAWDD